MTAVRKFRVKSKIAQLAFTSKGSSMVGEALARADQNVAELRAAGLAALDVCLSEMMTRYGPASGPRDPDMVGLYTLAGHVIDVGIHVPNSGVAEAALSLCELVDHLSGGAPDWKAIDVHLGALQVLRAHGEALGPAQRDKVLGGLRDVVAKLAGSAPA